MRYALDISSLKLELAEKDEEIARLRRELAITKNAIKKMAADIIAADNAGLAMIGNLADQVGTLQEELDNSDQELANQDDRIDRLQLALLTRQPVSPQ